MMTLEQVARALPFCRDSERRALVLEHPSLNGIDYVDYEPTITGPHVLTVHFFKPLPELSDADGAYGLTRARHLITIEGGARIVGIQVIEARRSTPSGEQLEILVDKAGDFSLYWLGFGWQRQLDGEWVQSIPELDRAFSIVPFSFRASCPVDFDCKLEDYCPPEERTEPIIDYMAKDYASFRQLLLDLIPQRNPDWLERSPADLGIALVELLAHEGDHLSYFQDAVAQEAHLDTVRQRISARRHARLIDYRMDDGRNAWTWVYVGATSTGSLDANTKVLTRFTARLQNGAEPDATVEIDEGVFETDPALSKVEVFETAFALRVHPENNAVRIHDWGNKECCLPVGTTCADLFALAPAADPSRAVRPKLTSGDYLLFEEVKGPVTGLAADADPMHRQVVRVTEVLDIADPAFAGELADGSLRPWAPGATPLPILRVRWDAPDALRFPICLSSRTPSGESLEQISVARGNITLADHGRTIKEQIALDEPIGAGEPIRLTLSSGPLSFQCQPSDAVYDGLNAVLTSERRELSCDTLEVHPAVAVRAVYASGDQLFTPVSDLLDSPRTAPHLVAEVEEGGRVVLRFGDDEYGQHPAGARHFSAVYRVGNGRRGNVGAEALSHVVRPPTAAGWPEITVVRNPVEARHGRDPETIEEVRKRAPAAFHAEQFRAVTEKDYTVAALKMDGIAGAIASFRWTGSWYTVYVGIDPAASEDLVTLPGGRTRLSVDFASRVHEFITRYRLAGYDLEIRAADYISLDIQLKICVLASYFRGNVTEAVRRALSSRVNPDGTRGFFHRDYFTFGQPVYLSRLYAAVEAVEGVESLVVQRFKRFGERDHAELDRGLISMGPWEIVRLDNDPNFMENGVLAAIIHRGFDIGVNFRTPSVIAAV